MATTTATVGISSADLTPGMSLGISATTTLYQTGTTSGLELVDMGAGKLTQASGADALHEALGTADNEINIEAEASGEVPYEYAIFKSTYTLPAKT